MGKGVVRRAGGRGGMKEAIGHATNSSEGWVGEVNGGGKGFGMRGGTSTRVSMGGVISVGW
eukprot:749350-Hanusia_phi.AAC.3